MILRLTCGIVVAVDVCHLVPISVDTTVFSVPETSTTAALIGDLQEIEHSVSFFKNVAVGSVYFRD